MGGVFFFFFLSLFNWAVLFMEFQLGGVPKNGGGGERVGGVFSFSFVFGDGKLKFW
jgi:hypothetical protein